MRMLVLMMLCLVTVLVERWMCFIIQSLSVYKSGLGDILGGDGGYILVLRESLKYCIMAVIQNTSMANEL
jgi:hypothetical protein